MAAFKLMAAHVAGIAVIAPGRHRRALTQPAPVPHVLAVGALAHTATSPQAETPCCSHRGPASTQPRSPPPARAWTLPPGTAVITTAPGGGYAPTDGTAIAAARITGLAALLLANHDHRLRTHPMTRTSARTNEHSAAYRLPSGFRRRSRPHRRGHRRRPHRTLHRRRLAVQPRRLGTRCPRCRYGSGVSGMFSVPGSGILQAL
uniref:hypothetical protein n=1 Tax=Streptomyces sp. CA-141956 TaxID=3240051 RepID=UPI003F4915DA